MLTALILGWAVLYADRTALYPLLSVIAKSLGITSAGAGAVSSAYFLFYVLLQIPSGMLADRWGTKRVLIIMFALSGLGNWGSACSGPPTCRCSSSRSPRIRGGAYYPCCFGTIMATVPPEKRGRARPDRHRDGAGNPLGGMAASGPLYEFFGNYRQPFRSGSCPPC